MICPIMSYRRQVASDVRDRYSGYSVECKEEGCAWWVKTSAWDTKENKAVEVGICAIVKLAEKEEV